MVRAAKAGSTPDNGVLNKRTLRYGVAVVATVAAFLWRWAMMRYIHVELGGAYITFYPAVMIVALLYGLGPGLVATAAAALLALFWILPAQLISETSDIVSVLLFTSNGVFLSLVAKYYRRARDKAADYEKQLALQETQKALQDSEARFRSMYQQAAVGIDQVASDGRLLMVNPALCHMLGYTETELLHRTFVEITHPDDRERETALLDAMFHGHSERYELEKRYVHRDGSVVWVSVASSLVKDGDGQPLYRISVIQDITDRKSSEHELHKFVLLADNSTELIGMCDMNLIPFYVNPAGMRLVGLDSLEQACRTPVQEFFFPEDQPFILKEFFPRVEHEGRGEVEIRFRHCKTGEPIWMLCNVFYVREASGQPVGLATVSHNITERKQAEEAVRTLSGRLITAQEEERTRIAREIHDDFAQRLALIKIQGQQVERALGEDKPAQREQLATMSKQITMLAADLRRLSHELHSNTLEVVGLAAALADLCGEVSQAHGIPVYLIDYGVPRDLSTDLALCIFRVVQEALANIVKHSGTALAEVEIAVQAHQLSLRVADYGRGFGSAVPPSGLGLTSMRERVCLAGGTLCIESQPGRGTELRVLVPLGRPADRVDGKAHAAHGSEL